MTKPKKQRVNPVFIYLTKEQKETLHRLAELKTTSASFIVRDALREYFKKELESNS
jgi:predicted transcriptional regulator